MTPALPLQVLVLEDAPQDAELLLRELRQAGFEIKWTRVDAEADYVAQLSAGLDVILADYLLPQFDGLRALDLLKERGFDVPFILVSGTIGEDLAVEAMKRGASDYLMKDRLARLGPAVKKALALRTLRREHTLAGENLRLRETALGHVSQGVLICDEKRLITYANLSFTKMTGFPLEEIIGRNCAFLQGAGTNPDTILKMRAAMDANEPFEGEILNYTRGGRAFWNELSIAPIRDERGGPVRFIGIQRDITERKRAEVELQRQQTELRLLFDYIPAIICFKDTENRILRVNRRLADTLGRPISEIEGKSSAEIFPNEAKRFFADDLEVIATGRPKLGIVESFFNTDGHEICIQTDKVPVHDKEGKIVGLVAMAQDMTGHKQAEKELRWKTAFLEAQVSSSLDGIIVVDQHGKKILQNQQAVDLFKMPPHIANDSNDSQQVEWVKSMTKDPAQFIGKIVHLYAHPDETSHDEIDLKDGTVIDRYSFPVVGEDKECYGRTWAFRDITERKRVQQALQTSEKRFKALFEQAAVGVALTDASSGRFVQVNQRYSEIVGRTSDELAQVTFSEPTHPRDIAADMEMTVRLRAGAIREFTREKRYMRKDGTEVWANVTVSAMWAPGDPPDYVISIAQDITERKKLEEQFRQVQKMEAIGTLAGGIAHDFNNILAAIVGYSSLARMQLTDNPKVRDHIDAVLKASSRATDLVRQILAFSRKQPLERRPIQLKGIVTETMELLRATIPATIEFDLSLAADAPTVLADTTQIHQILMNLGTNAVHAMAERNGWLQVKLERFMVDAELASTQRRLRAGVYARLSVSDTGCGMDRATQERIFEPFFTTKATGEGTGLGLSVVHGIMDNHDGAITVYSEPGTGTIFHLYFPEHGGMTLMPATNESAVPLGDGERLLFVDDETSLCDVGQKMLMSFGYRVDIVSKPTDALACVQNDPQRYALVLTDQTMPGMTGIFLATQLRMIRPDLPVILMTGYSGSLILDRVKASGVTQLLLKPIGMRALGLAVHEAISKTSAP